MRYFAPNLLPWNKRFRTRENVQVDDLVLEVDPNHKRSKWKLARVIVTYSGNDGLVIKARIKTQDGEYDRPIHKLCPIATKDERLLRVSIARQPWRCVTRLGGRRCTKRCGIYPVAPNRRRGSRPGAFPSPGMGTCWKPWRGTFGDEWSVTCTRRRTTGCWTGLMGCSHQTITSVPMRLASGPSSIATVAKICTSTVWRRRMRRSSCKKNNGPFGRKCSGWTIWKPDGCGWRVYGLAPPRPSEYSQIPIFCRGPPRKTGSRPHLQKSMINPQSFEKRTFIYLLGRSRLALVAFLVNQGMRW